MISVNAKMMIYNRSLNPFMARLIKKSWTDSSRDVNGLKVGSKGGDESLILHTKSANYTTKRDKKFQYLYVFVKIGNVLLCL